MSTSKRIAIFPGTFDPVTAGHESMVVKASQLFDEIIVAIGYNASKPTGYFSMEQRMEFLRLTFQHIPNVKIDAYQGLTTDFCKQKNARFILRGLRSSTDFEYERNIAQANNALVPEIETVFLISSPGLSAVNSSIVRDIHRHGGDVKQFLPTAIHYYF